MKKSPIKATTPDTGIPPSDAFEVHRQMVIALFIATLLLCILLGIGLIFLKVTALMTVAAAGALGGFVSALRRLYAFQRVFPLNFFKSWHKEIDYYLIIYSLIPSLVGAIAAVTLYLVFASKLVESNMFPEFHLSNVNHMADNFQDFVENWQPKLPMDYAKAIVWGFLAGFSERFVPDLLEHFASSQQQEMSKESTANRPPEE